MKKISWGTGIALSIILFTIISLSFMFFAMSQQVHLVSEDYYEQEIKHQDQIDRINRTNALPEQPIIKIDTSFVIIQFPTNFNRETISGEILLFRPSDSNDDVQTKIDLDSTNTQLISTKNMIQGLWRAKILWNIDSTAYYSEKNLMVR